jgi:hypothetical protein
VPLLSRRRGEIVKPPSGSELNSCVVRRAGFRLSGDKHFLARRNTIASDARDHAVLSESAWMLLRGLHLFGKCVNLVGHSDKIGASWSPIPKIETFAMALTSCHRALHLSGVVRVICRPA